MRGVFLWLVGIPIPVIILLYVFHVIWPELYRSPAAPCRRRAALTAGGV